MLFKYLKKPRDLTSYNLMTGVTDFGNLVQFNMYESGYAALIVIRIPKFLEKLAETNSDYASLINNYKHILEREFKSLDGINDIDTEKLEISDGINNVEVIGKVNHPVATQFSMKLQEKSGSTITRVNELYLTGIRDPRGGQAKHYHGLIEQGLLEAGFENETFTFLYINTDNTMRQLEKAYLLTGCQINSAKTSIYNYEKGDIAFRDVDIEFSGFSLTSNTVDQKAQKYLDWLHKSGNLKINSANFDYTGVDKLNPPE